MLRDEERSPRDVADSLYIEILLSAKMILVVS